MRQQTTIWVRESDMESFRLGVLPDTYWTPGQYAAGEVPDSNDIKEVRLMAQWSD